MIELTKEQIKKLSTSRLLAYKRKINHSALACGEDWVHDCDCDECMTFKKRKDKWMSIYNNLKLELSTREHVENNKRNKKIKKH